MEQNRVLKNKPSFSMKVSKKFKGERIVFSTNSAILFGYSGTHKKRNLDFYFTLDIRIKSKWTIGLKVRAKTLKLLVENTGESL